MSSKHSSQDVELDGFDEFPVDDVSDDSNVLLIFPENRTSEKVVCRDLHTKPALSESTCVEITNRDVLEFEERWSKIYQSNPQELHLVTTALNSEYQDHFTEGSIKTFVENDMTGLGLTLTNLLSQNDNDRELTICFHALNDVLDKNGLEATFRFLHILMSRIENSENVTAHYHLDPDQLTNSEMSTLMELFDVAVTYDSKNWLFKRT